jgi:hypothetical protein
MLIINFVVGAYLISRKCKNVAYRSGVAYSNYYFYGNLKGR